MHCSDDDLKTTYGSIKISQNFFVSLLVHHKISIETCYLIGQLYGRSKVSPLFIIQTYSFNTCAKNQSKDVSWFIFVF